MNSPRHGILGGPAGQGRRARVIDTLVLHDGLIDFRTLCERAVPPDTRYLVLDLDRTFHFGRNLGELLGWELCALASYGQDFLNEAEPRRKPSRFVWDWSHPLSVLHYVVRGGRLWAYPGLLYLFAVKLGMKSDRVRPRLYQHFGGEPVEAVQQVPRNALLHHMSEVPMDTLLQLARNVWRRFEADQVIERSDVAWLRERCPGIRIIISSASPQPVLEVAAEQLGVDDVLYTAVEEHEGYLSAPYAISRLFMLFRPPRRISPPSSVYVNAGKKKMARLLERYPDFLDADVETVGITDTSYGEDHAWADFFKVVIDVNSPHPFAPIVSASSPLREIHSALLLTQAEQRDPGCIKRRPRAQQGGSSATGERRVSSEALRARLAALLLAVERLAERHDEQAIALQEQRAPLETRLSALLAKIEVDAHAFNDSVGAERNRALRRLRDHLRDTREIERRLVRLEQPLSGLSWSVTRLLEMSRAWAEAPDDGGPPPRLDGDMVPADAAA